MSEDWSKLYLENQICFPLYATSRLTTKLYAPFLKELDITYPQYLVLLVLWEYKERTVNEIGDLLLLESNTLTPLLKRLEQKQFITRTRSKSDERSVLISLTAKGTSLREQAIRIPDRIAAGFADESLSTEEVLQFQQTLWKLLRLLDNKSTDEQSDEIGCSLT